MSSTIIRTIRESDAETFLELCLRLDGETQFRLLEAGERSLTLEQQTENIRRVLSRENQTILVAERDGQLVGYLGAFGGDYRRNRRSAWVVVSVLQAYTRQGLGRRLFLELEGWARQQSLHRLELCVMAHNTPAIGLYRKMGFQVEGTKIHSLCIDGVYVDELLMAKILDPSNPQQQEQ